MNPDEGVGRRIRFLADHNFRDAIVTGLRHKHPLIDIITARDVDIQLLPDPQVLAYAKEHGRLLLTHDKRTMPGYLDELLRALSAGEHGPGGFVVPQRMATGKAINDLLLIWEASEPEEWRNRLTFLPL